MVFVVIGENNAASVNLASRCVWNEACDGFVDFTYRNSAMFATAVVYSVYQE